MRDQRDPTSFQASDQAGRSKQCSLQSPRSETASYILLESLRFAGFVLSLQQLLFAFLHQEPVDLQLPLAEVWQLFRWVIRDGYVPLNASLQSKAGLAIYAYFHIVPVTAVRSPAVMCYERRWLAKP